MFFTYTNASASGVARRMRLAANQVLHAVAITPFLSGARPKRSARFVEAYTRTVTQWCVLTVRGADVLGLHSVIKSLGPGLSVWPSGECHSAGYKPGQLRLWFMRCTQQIGGEVRWCAG